MNRTVFIIGASGAIGRATALLFGEEGAQLILHYNQNEEAIERLIDDLPEHTVLQTIKSDIRTSSGIHHLIQSLTFHVDVVVFASGVNQYGLLQDISEEEMDHLYHIHVKTPWLVSKAVLPSMITNQKGHLVLVSSIWGEVGAGLEVLYSSVKGAQDSFVKALAKEVGRSGIHVNGVRPGYIDTKMNDHLSSEEQQLLKDEIPVGRFGEAKEVASVIRFLCSDESSYMHGQLLNVNGAWQG
ncbi:3-ketoacyl-ACP reductase [Pontibacillus halophilus JSM 076056 = DSM 19796]|uniref:3-ketoacyl-ACP reductase n=1 Tax=Pontibacillus halophilus JSM 076056 = DSM 19796 TaxID=1385510 RepID=A0A0A5GPE0_9BACI|nr:SDR family oxidoreductase [Pontibacillus halophilus]KGX93108.1 3-ketoacyl-ACP reductase [Pontibacillus halophilus JSM 076056 = DSM 19796]